jgi:CheY-like chemotaxis protein
MQEKLANKILYVDDDKLLLDMYSIKFSKAGYQFKAIDSTQGALKMIRDGFVPDILLVDIIMPDMDGLDFVAAVKREKLLPESSIIVMLTNQSLSDDIQRAKKLDVDGYIIKSTTIPSQVYDEILKIYKNKNNK